MTVTSTGESAERAVFSPDDHCDRCRAQARFLVLLPSGGQLAFCGHHGREHRKSLEAAIWMEDPAEVPAVHP